MRTALIAAILGWGTAVAQETAPKMTVENFPRHFELVKPYAGEFAWRDEIPWEISLRGAQEKAAAQDKPILVLRTNDGPALGAA
jgi:hypothetical protein